MLNTLTLMRMPLFTYHLACIENLLDHTSVYSQPCVTCLVSCQEGIVPAFCNLSLVRHTLRFRDA